MPVDAADPTTLTGVVTSEQPLSVATSIVTAEKRNVECIVCSRLSPIVRRFLGNLDVVRMGFDRTSMGYAYEASSRFQVGNRPGSAVA